MSNLKRLTVGADRTHHIFSDKTPAYSQRFDEVLAFHNVCNKFQLAPVRLHGKAWHITSNAEAIYSARFDRTFGFYCGLAAVKVANEWFHIDVDGQAAYPQRYAFVGNYQDDIVIVCDNDGNYFHIDKLGTPLYDARWRYCGDFREGIAVVQSEAGLSSHIDKCGNLIHQQWYLDLDIFHKNYARAKDQSGWHHIEKTGVSVYLQRYTSVEAFYNGCSRVETFDGALQVIDESGNILRILRKAQTDHFASLSADLVGYWHTFTIAAAVELGVFDHLPASLSELIISTQTLPERLIRLLNALAELQLINYNHDRWFASEKGVFLAQGHDMSLASASLEYQSELLKRWYKLAKMMKCNVEQDDIFQKVASKPCSVKSHHQMLRSYAKNHYANLIPLIDIKQKDVVFDAGGGNGAFVEMLSAAYPETRIVLGDLPEVIAESQVKEKVGFDLFKLWPISADKIILARILHDWDDSHACQILINATSALNKNGKLYIFEMLLSNRGFSGSLCDLHLLTVTGGQERTLQHYEKLASKAGLHLSQTIDDGGLVSVLCFTS